MESSTSDFYRKKYITTLAYAVGVLLFLLPFVVVKCNGKPYVENSGVGLSLGTDYKTTVQINDGDQDKNNRLNISSLSYTKEKGKLYVSALIALLLGISGVILSLSRRRHGAAIMIIGALAAIALIILAFQVKNDLKDEQLGENKVTLEFTIWYYLSVVSFLAASFFGFKQSNDADIHKIPPKHAPQVNIKNPGEQSEFPTSPDESEMER